MADDRRQAAIDVLAHQRVARQLLDGDTSTAHALWPQLSEEDRDAIEHRVDLVAETHLTTLEAVEASLDYLHQTGRQALTPAQRRRAAQKERRAERRTS